MSILKQIRKYLQNHLIFRRIFYSFFFRLILLDFKKNQSLVLFWLIFFAIITDNFATRYGVAYLFLVPEYMNNAGVLAYFITGFSFGGFIMAYNISSYVRNAFRFPFLATLKNPFFKYCLNNFFLPTSFFILYITRIYYFLHDEGNLGILKILLLIFALIIGIITFLTFAFFYSWKTNKDITRLYGIRSSEFEAVKVHTRKIISGQRNPSLIKESRDWYVETYLFSPFKLRLVRSVRHYKKETLHAVIKQNHNAAFVYQISSIFSLLILGFFSHIPAFAIPAGASIFLLFTMFIMLYCSFYTWFRGWSAVVFIFFLIAFNFLYKEVAPTSENKAYGLNYDTIKAGYNYDHFKQTDKQHYLLNQDINYTLDILEKWKNKNINPVFPDKKPKLVFINTSGGGLRSALWTLYTMQQIDSLSGGEFMKRIQLISGSSGGMIGASYFRELYASKQKDNSINLYSTVFIDNMSKDILNPIAFSIATNEWFFPIKHFDIDNKSYPEDRGYAFESRLNQNTNDILKNKRLANYAEPESKAEIPMMVFSPSIVNDGRKMLISPIGISYLTQNNITKNINYNKLFDAVEFSRFFDAQKATQVLFSSVLRMSATFPYISPMVSLPSEPRIEVMDAGLRDNYGLETTLQFINTFNDWIANNTNGILIIQIRDKNKNVPIDDNPSQTLSEALSKPIGSFYNSLFEVQDYNQNQQIQMADGWCKSKIDIVDIQLRNERKDKISLSWHLTNREKQKVLHSIDVPENQEAIKRILELIK